MHFTTDNRPRRNQLTDRYHPWQMLTLHIKGKLTRKKVSTWIKEEPDRLFFHVYDPKQHGLEPVRLSIDATRDLKKALKEKHPVLYQLILDRRKKHLEKAAKRKC
ncbi:MAG: hypothetical protein J5I47_02495 [Vicingus serpentipes]|nr:hypothetical protein [Vicingus serpentipes]